MEKLLSIVIPVYCVERYIKKCLDSLLVPTEKLALLDVVIVNDGTPDRSAEIAREYENRYPEVFRVIDKENGGHGSAWNLGTEIAVGKYLFYLDSDDWVDTEQFSSLIDVLQEYDVDMVLMDRTKYFAREGRKEVVELQNMIPGVVYDANTYDWLRSGNGSNITYAHNSVYRTSMMQEYLPVFCEHVMYDDIILQVMPIMVAKCFVYTKLNVYHYLIGRPGQSFDPVIRAKHANDVSTVIKQVLDFISRYRNVPPVGSTRKAWAEEFYSSFPTHHYRELSDFSYKVSKERLSEWDKFIVSHYPDIQLTPTVRRYRSWPFPFYFIWFKVDAFLNKAKRFSKRVKRASE